MLSVAALASSAAQGSIGAVAPTGPSPRLVKAAHEFEAQMMKELLKPLSNSSGLNGEEEDSSAGSGGALGEFASEALGRGLSEQGGFGIASSIVRQLTPVGNK
jgi:Rod binding domain-containing protein